jgi:hypothetical protein
MSCTSESIHLGECMYVHLVGIRFGRFPSAESALWKLLCAACRLALGKKTSCCMDGVYLRRTCVLSTSNPLFSPPC